MGIRRTFIVTLSGLVVACGVSCAPPERHYTDDQLKQVTSRKDLMDFLATEADPGFALAKDADPATITPEQVARLGAIGRALRGVPPRLAEPAFSKGPEFNKLAAELGDKLKAMEAAAASKDGGKTLQATLSAKATCAACHSAFR